MHLISQTVGSTASYLPVYAACSINHHHTASRFNSKGYLPTNILPAARTSSGAGARFGASPPPRALDASGSSLFHNCREAWKQPWKSCRDALSCAFPRPVCCCYILVCRITRHACTDSHRHAWTLAINIPHLLFHPQTQQHALSSPTPHHVASTYALCGTRSSRPRQ